MEGTKPGIALDLIPIPEHLRNTYRFSNEPEVRKKEIETFLMLDKVAVASEKEDRKCSPVASCSSSKSDTDHDSDSEIESKKEDRKCSPAKSPAKKPRLQLKMREGESDKYRVKTNLDHGITKPAKKQTKQAQMWDYVEQTLAKNLVIQVLPLPAFEFRFSKKMTMKEVTDPCVLATLKRFLTPTTTTIRLADIQTEKLDELNFRFVVVRKRLSGGLYSYALLPNMVMTSDKQVFQKPPNNIWYEKATTTDREAEMTMPRPFIGNQSVKVLFQNTFGWDV